MINDGNIIIILLSSVTITLIVIVTNGNSNSFACGFFVALIFIFSWFWSLIYFSIKFKKKNQVFCTRSSYPLYSIESSR